VSLAAHCLAASTSVSQEALRISLAGEAAAERRHAFEEQPGNIQIGRSKILLSAALGLELNDNVNYSDEMRQKDFIIGPELGVTGLVPLSEANTLYLSLDLSYLKYLRYSQYDRLLIAPFSQLGFDIYVKDFHFNLHDQVSLTDQPIAQGTISGVGVYNEFANVVGVSADWDLNDAVISAGFDHQNAISTKSYYSYLDRNVESFFARTTLQFSQAVTAGPEASIGLVDYDKPLLNDNLNYSIGLFADWLASAHLHLKPRIGYTHYTFDPLPGQQEKPPDADNFYFSLLLSQQLNEFVNFSIDAGRQLSLGVNSDLINLWYVRPVANLRLLEKVSLRCSLVFEDGQDIGNSVLVQNETYTLLGWGVGASYQLTDKVMLNLAYDYSVKSSDIPVRNYHRNRVTLRLQYTF
jgi:opacity protein-like surface antigen